MAYTYNDAINAVYDYLGIEKNEDNIIPNTNGRGIIYELNGERMVLFISPIGCKQNNAQNWVDTRDSGVNERRVAWNYSIDNDLKYFSLCVNSEQDRYKDYFFSLENTEEKISDLSYRKKDGKTGTGTQANIPGDFIPSKPFERISTDKGINFAVIGKDYINTYLTVFDNRPYNDNINCSDVEAETEDAVPANGGINKIFYGAPGCGKSRYVSDMLHDANVKKENIVRVTFHPEYSNVDFIGQILPTIEKDEDDKDVVKYIFNPGSFTLALLKAYNTTDMVYLVVEEINRGNAAAIFGDMFQLLDRIRDTTKPDYSSSEYPVSNPNMQKYLKDEVKNEAIQLRLSDGVYIPSNLTIFATMNSSDQNVFTLDTAFKRRWSFEQISNNIEKDSSHAYKKWYVPGTDVTWESFLTKLNLKILEYKIHNQTNEDKRLGKYFVTQDCLTEHVESISNVQDAALAFSYKVLEYIWNDVCKIGREEWFDTERYRTLEDLIDAFINPAEGETPLSLFQNIAF